MTRPSNQNPNWTHSKGIIIKVLKKKKHLQPQLKQHIKIIV